MALVGCIFCSTKVGAWKAVVTEFLWHAAVLRTLDTACVSGQAHAQGVPSKQRTRAGITHKAAGMRHEAEITRAPVKQHYWRVWNAKLMLLWQYNINAAPGWKSKPMQGL